MTTVKDRLKPDSIIKNHYGGNQRHTPRFIVGYWSIRGLAAPIQMLLSAAQIDHWVVMYDVRETEEGWDKSSWEHDKQWLQEQYPLINLPFLVDCADCDSNNDRVVSQTNAILAYLGRELKMLGTTPQETCQCEELLCEIMDLRNKMVKFAYSATSTRQGEDKEEAKQMIAQANSHFKKLEKHLILQYPNAKERSIDESKIGTAELYLEGVCHLVQDKCTAPDFHLWEMLNQFVELCKYYELPCCLGTAETYHIGQDQQKTELFPYLCEFEKGFIQLSANSVYATMNMLNGVVVDDQIKLPLNNPYARFGSDPKPGRHSGFGKYARGQEAPWRNLGVISRDHTRIDSGIECWDDEASKNAEKKRRIE